MTRYILLVGSAVSVRFLNPGSAIDNPGGVCGCGVRAGQWPTPRLFSRSTPGGPFQRIIQLAAGGRSRKQPRGQPLARPHPAPAHPPPGLWIADPGFKDLTDTVEPTGKM